jgi:hypothetical protein
MAKGKNRKQILGFQGSIQSDKYADWDFLYTVSVAKDNLYNIGDVVDLADGRQFRYARSTGATVIPTSKGCEFTSTGYTAIGTFATSHAIGVKEVTVPAGTHAALTADELRGGYAIIFDGASDLYTTTRGIIGNDAAIANAAFKIQLDSSLTYAVTASTSKIETYQNPWGYLTGASISAKPKAGLAASYVSAVAQYFWVQTKGLTWVTPQDATVGANGGIGCYWRQQGNIESTNTSLAVTTAALDSSQYAGFVVEGSYTGNGPLFMLT